MDFMQFDLPLENGRKFYLREGRLVELKDELDEFLDGQENMNNPVFAKKVLFSHELQSNNQIEGYNDDIEIINDIISRRIRKINDESKKQRILNLYRGYQFILKHKKVNEKSLRKLYDILSNQLLEEYDVNHMGKFYREDIVYILSGFLDCEDEEQGVEVENISNLMQKYFNFYNHAKGESLVDKYIISQMLHLYFVYIHPYFDVNGRTSRTMSMWYLIKNDAYPFIIFNRGIPFHRNEYYRMISNAKQTHDMTAFILFMLNEVKVELEKEYLVQNIAQNSKNHLVSEDYQTLLYFISTNGERTLLDFSTLYNRLIDRKKPQEIYEKMILPLIDKEILIVTRYCQKKLPSGIHNMSLEINPHNLTIEKEKVKRLVI